MKDNKIFVVNERGYGMSDLKEANLEQTDLEETNLKGANLKGAKESSQNNYVQVSSGCLDFQDHNHQ